MIFVQPVLWESFTVLQCVKLRGENWPRAVKIELGQLKLGLGLEICFKKSSSLKQDYGIIQKLGMLRKFQTSNTECIFQTSLHADSEVYDIDLFFQLSLLHRAPVAAEVSQEPTTLQRSAPPPLSHSNTENIFRRMWCGSRWQGTNACGASIRNS